MFSNSCKNRILCYYALELFEDEIHNMNKNCYSNFHVHTEDKSVLILAEEIKYSKMNESSETKNSKDNSSVVANSDNNKNKYYNQGKNYQQSNINFSVNKIRP